MDSNTQKKVRAARNLIKTCEKSLLYDEYNIRNIRGVSVTYSDVETIVLYCKYYIENKTFNGLTPPVGEVKEVLSKINLVN